MDAQLWHAQVIAIGSTSLAKDFLMHARLAESAKGVELHHPASFGVLLTPSIKKNCIDLLVSLGYEVQGVDFIENDVTETPLDVQQHYERRIKEQQREEMLRYPLAQFLSEQPGFRYIQ